MRSMHWLNPAALLKRFDRLQQAHPWLAFPYAVLRKYGEDEGSYQAAIITYYSFLSLFPLVLAATSVLKLVLGGNPHQRARILSAVNHYVPVIGNELQANVHSTARTSIALFISALFALYGARGVADAIRHALDHIWQVPHVRRSGFPQGMVQSFGIILIGGGGLVFTAWLSSYATSLGHSIWFRAAASLLSFALLVLLLRLVFLIGVSTPKVISRRAALYSAVIAGVGLQLLQTVGGYLITHELKRLSTVYGTFALILGLLFWIYLQAEVVLYAVEAGSVAQLRLWPRSLTQKPLTRGDERAYKLYAARERRSHLM